MSKATKITGRIVLILIAIALLAGLVFVIASGFFLQPKYLEGWKKDYHMEFSDKRLKVAAHGLLAPSAFNMQPWKVKLSSADQNSFYLYAHAESALKVDENYNDMFMCQGTFTEFCVTAARQLGYDCTVELFPDGEPDSADMVESAKQKPVAKFTLVRTDTEPDEEQTLLYNQSFLPHTNRGIYYGDRAVTAAQKQIIEGAAGGTEGISVSVYTGAASVAKIREFALRGKEAEQKTERLAEQFSQNFRTNEYIKNQLRYGFSLEEQGFSGLKLQLGQGVITLMPFLQKGDRAADKQIAEFKKALNSTPGFIVIKSNQPETRTAQVKAGRAYARIMLAANLNGMSLHPVSQTAAPYSEAGSVRQEYNDLFSAEGYVPLFTARVGIAQKPAVKTMRKSLDTLLLAG